MESKQTRKVSIRVHPVVAESLKLLAEIDSMTVSDFVRGCINYVLTEDPRHLSKYIREAGLGAFFALDDVESWREVSEAVNQSD